MVSPSMTTMCVVSPKEWSSRCVCLLLLSLEPAFHDVLSKLPAVSSAALLVQVSSTYVSAVGLLVGIFTTWPVQLAPPRLVTGPHCAQFTVAMVGLGAPAK